MKPHTILAAAACCMLMLVGGASARAAPAAPARAAFASAARLGRPSTSLHARRRGKQSVPGPLATPMIVEAPSPARARWFGRRAAGAALVAVTSVLLPHPAMAAASGAVVDAAAGGGGGLMSYISPGFAQAYSLIFLSELGDKTFFVAGLLAIKYSRLISFTGSVGALGVMSVIAVLIGQVFHTVPASVTNGLPLDDIAAAALFAYFGLKTIKDSYDLPSDGGDANDELEDAQQVVDEVGEKAAGGTLALILQTFSLVFVAEIGDKSFISTIGLGAAQNPVSVALGAIAGHATATGIAVVSGGFVSRFLSEKVIGYIGGVLFLLFSGQTWLGLLAR